MLLGHQRITWRRNIAENFNRLSRVHERYRQTTDRQTTTTYSEHEHEFTFAKNGFALCIVMCIDLPWMVYIKYIPGAPLKTGPFFKVCNSCIRWRRKVIHISNCSVLYLVVHVLNFVTVKYFCCIGLVKQYYTKNNGSPIIFRSHVTANSLFFNVLDFIKAERSIYQNVQYYVRSKNCVLNFTAVCIFAQCNETIWR